MFPATFLPLTFAAAPTRAKRFTGLFLRAWRNTFINRAYTLEFDESSSIGLPRHRGYAEQKSFRHHRARSQQDWHFHRVLRGVHRLQHASGASDLYEVEEQLYKELK